MADDDASQRRGADRERKVRSAWLLAVAVTLLACEPAPASSTGAAPTAATSAPAVASSGPRPAGPSYDAAKLHVPADFEAEAESAITKDNYRDTLAELHEEITGEAYEGAGGAKAAPAPSGSVAP